MKTQRDEKTTKKRVLKECANNESSERENRKTGEENYQSREQDFLELKTLSHILINSRH